MADSQIVYTEMVAEPRTEEAYPTVRKSIGVTPKKHIPPCVRIA